MPSTKYVQLRPHILAPLHFTVEQTVIFLIFRTGWIAIFTL